MKQCDCLQIPPDGAVHESPGIHGIIAHGFMGRPGRKLTSVASWQSLI